MYAAHFAAGLALKGRAPKLPMMLLLITVFVLDVLWITFASAHEFRRLRVSASAPSFAQNRSGG